MTRTDDVDPSVPLDDPSGWPARVPSPAQGLHGTYILTKTEKLATPTQDSKTYAGDTRCLRTGDKCVTFFTEPGSSTPLIMAFADGKWTVTDTDDEMSCDASGFDTRHQTETAEYPLPQPVMDPFPVINGHGSVSWYGQTCGGDYKYDAKLERKGD